MCCFSFLHACVCISFSLFVVRLDVVLFHLYLYFLQTNVFCFVSFGFVEFLVLFHLSC